ncbi:hypothetical protein Lepto7375DRAFT_0552 [Leptolyngbya sp. PCC 7375]|nr:hypothetical protein Lepto7375DRAFT_0552 [Leptolyngbya sp. PCC 7375]
MTTYLQLQSAAIDASRKYRNYRGKSAKTLAKRKAAYEAAQAALDAYQYEQGGKCVERLIRKLSTVKELREEAKRRGFRGYSRNLYSANEGRGG